MVAKTDPVVAKTDSVVAKTGGVVAKTERGVAAKTGVGGFRSQGDETKDMG